MNSWLYVLEINNGARVKVGKTTSLGGRLGTHMQAAALGGGDVTRVSAVLIDDADAAEIELIGAVGHQPAAKTVCGREVFTGVSFARAVELAEKIAFVRSRKAYPVEAGDRPAASEPPSTALLTDCISAAASESRMHLAELLDRVVGCDPETYRDLDVWTLGKRLRAVGVPVAATWRHGRTKQGVRAVDLLAAEKALRAS